MALNGITSCSLTRKLEQSIKPLLVLVCIIFACSSHAARNSKVFWGLSATKIEMKSAIGSPEFTAPMISMNIEGTGNLIFQGRLAYGGKGDTSADLEHFLGLYGMYRAAKTDGLQPYLLFGLSTTKISFDPLLATEDDTSTGFSLGLGVAINITNSFKLAFEALGLNRDNGEVNTALSVNLFFRF